MFRTAFIAAALLVAGARAGRRPTGGRPRRGQRHADVLRGLRRGRSADRAARRLHEHPVDGRDHPEARRDPQGLRARVPGPRPHHRHRPADHLSEPGGRRGGLHGRGRPREGRRVRLFDGRRRRAAARHPPSGEGEQARRGVRRLRRRGLAAGVQGLHPADDGRDVRRHAVRRGLSQARRQSRRLSRAGREADRAREGADGVGGGREGAEDAGADHHRRRRRRDARAFGRDVPAARRRRHGRHGQAAAGLAPRRPAGDLAHRGHHPARPAASPSSSRS